MDMTKTHCIHLWNVQRIVHITYDIIIVNTYDLLNIFYGRYHYLFQTIFKALAPDQMYTVST